MSLIFSKSCEYATQAILFLAKKKSHDPVLLRDISEALQIPHHFLNKVLQLLSRDGLIVSQKGSNGGFALGRDAKTITLSDIVRAVDGEAFLNECVLGFPQCGDPNPCPVHKQWLLAKTNIIDMLNQRTVDDLSNGLQGKLDLIEQLKNK